MKSPQTQDLFLRTLIANETPVVIFMLNGFQVHGVIRSFDTYTLHVRNIHDQQQILYKQAISTIQSEKAVVQ